MIRNVFRAIMWSLLILFVVGYVVDVFTPDPPAPEEPESEASAPVATAQAPEAEPTPEERAASHWNISTRTSEIDDSINVHLSRSSDRITRNTIGGTAIPKLFITCRENSTSIYVFWDRFITTGRTNVLTRIDEEQARTHRWNVSTGNDATGLWRGSGIPFIRSLFGKERLLIEVTPYGSDSQRAVFDISGLEMAIKPLRQSCNW